MSVNSWPAAMLKNTGALKITDLILSNHLYQGTTFSVFVLSPLNLSPIQFVQVQLAYLEFQC